LRTSGARAWWYRRRSPTALFDALSNAALDWQQVWVTLTDERWVDATSADSNEHLVRAHLLRNAAARANFVGMKSDAATRVRPPPRCGRRSRHCHGRSTTCCWHGDDGHTASLFPGSPGIDAALDALQPPACVGMIAPVAPLPRMSLNLSALLAARRIGLLIIGAGKWRRISVPTATDRCADAGAGAVAPAAGAAVGVLGALGAAEIAAAEHAVAGCAGAVNRRCRSAADRHQQLLHARQFGCDHRAIGVVESLTATGDAQVGQPLRVECAARIAPGI